MEGQNVVLARRDAEGQFDRLPALAVELVRLPVDVIVATGMSRRSGRPCRRPRPFPSSWRKLGMRWRDRPRHQSKREQAGTSQGCAVISPDLVGRRLELLRRLPLSGPRIAVLLLSGRFRPQ